MLTGINHIKKRLIVISCLFICSISSLSAERECSDSLFINVYFRQDVADIEMQYRDNGASLDRFLSEIKKVASDSSRYIQDITIRSSASPEGSYAHNKELSIVRGRNLKDCLQKALLFPDEKFIIDAVGGDWDSLREKVEQNNSVPDREKILDILENHPGDRKKKLMDLSGGRTWEWLLENIYPDLRRAAGIVVCRYTRGGEPEPVRTSVPEAAKPTVPEPEETASVPQVLPEEEKPHTIAGPQDEMSRRNLFALKTNLLFDLGTAVNAEVEIPIGKRLSIAGEWIFPNWVDRNANRYCMQANVKSVEARCWLGSRNARPVMTGHFLGVYGQWGDLDVQPFTERGLRVNSLSAYGLSYGFAHPINRANTLRLEYSIGLAYARANYLTYWREEQGRIIASKEEWRFNTKRFPFPTKAKLSLVWMITYRHKATR